MSKSMVKPALAVLTVLAVVFGALFGWKAYQRHQQASARHGPPAVTVNVAKASHKKWQHRLSVIASVTAVNGIHVASELSGDVVAIHFHSGEFVKKGALLVQVQNANQKAQLERDRAQLTLAGQNLHRDRHLYARHATSEATVQKDEADSRTAQAAVANDRATLAKLAIRAPFSGHLGIRQVNLGQYVSPGTPIVPLTQWNPVHVDFTVPQSALGQIHTGQTVRFQVDADPGKHFKATVTAINSEVNAGTRNVALRATANNPHHLLRPGMFARLDVLTGKPRKVVVVPRSAITYSTFGDYVYKVVSKKEHGGDRQVAVQQPVRTGSSRGKWVVIASGLKAGVTVVTHGQIKLHNGMPVKPQSGGAPGAG